MRPLAKRLGISKSHLVRWRLLQPKMIDWVQKPDVSARSQFCMTEVRPSTINVEPRTRLFEWIDGERVDLHQNITVTKVILKLRELEPRFEYVERHIIQQRLWRLFRRYRIVI
jgi:hypothetical protein